MALAIDWKLVEAAEAIERAFALNKIDCGYTGDWEDVRKELCVKGLGLPMPPKPFNSVDDFRRKIGIGCFSEQALLNMGEFDDDAVEKYLERACREFAVSREGMEILGEHGQASNVHMFLDIAINLCAVTVDTMTVEDVREILLQIFPRKVSMEAEFCEEVVAEIGAFWRFVDRVYDVEHANEIANSVIGLTSRFRDAMSDSSNFGMAKSMFMMGDQAGFDMMSQEGRNEFMVAYNESLYFDHRADQAPPPPMSVEQKRLDRKQRKKLLAAKTRSKKKR